MNRVRSGSAFAVHMPKKRYILFAFLAIAATLVLSTSVVIAGDLYLHHKYTDLVGLNVWGYRGPALGRKQANEFRLAVVGESTAFGYGVRWDEAFPAYLQQRVQSKVERPVTVVNLAYNGEGAHSYKYTLADYKYLNADAVLFYAGYNDLGGPNRQVFRHKSPVFRVTGYLPIFPIIFAEKAMTLRKGVLVDAYSPSDKTTFRPNITQRATASALETAVSIEKSLESQIGRGLVDTTVDEGTLRGSSCGERWAHYCGEMLEAVDLALRQGKRVLLVTQPLMNGSDAQRLHRQQQERWHELLQQKFGNDPRIFLADVNGTVDLKDPAVAYDGMHLTARGNQAIAAALVPHVLDLMH
jgi:lysophospholipase L1-like esterase